MNWLRKFMSGRYGVDQLSIFLLLISIVLSISSRFVNSSIISIVALVLAILAYYRVLSKDISRRYHENNQLLKVWNPIKNKFKNIISRIKNMKDYKYFKCPNCKQKLRVPRGKGKISITCPKCKTEIIKKS